MPSEEILEDVKRKLKCFVVACVNYSSAYWEKKSTLDKNHTNADIISDYTGDRIPYSSEGIKSYIVTQLQKQDVVAFAMFLQYYEMYDDVTIITFLEWYSRVADITWPVFRIAHSVVWGRASPKALSIAWKYYKKSGEWISGGAADPRPSPRLRRVLKGEILEGTFKVDKNISEEEAKKNITFKKSKIVSDIYTNEFGHAVFITKNRDSELVLYIVIVDHPVPTNLQINEHMTIVGDKQTVFKGKKEPKMYTPAWFKNLGRLYYDKVKVKCPELDFSFLEQKWPKGVL